MCDECGTAFATPSRLKRHKKQVHFKVKDHTCGECGKAFGEAGNLDKHRLTVRQNIKKFVCKDCGSTYSQSHNLKSLIKKFHTDRPLAEHNNSIKRGRGRPPQICKMLEMAKNEQ